MENDHGPKSTLASRISKAARSGLKRIPTSIDLRRYDTLDSSNSSNKRSKVIPSTAPSTPPDEQDKKIESIDDTFIATDEAEADRIQFKSDLIRLAFDGEFSIPLDLQELHGGKLLDIGCGPGSYCLEMAQSYPNVDVYGIDIVDVFPLSPLPTNCTFLVMNALDDQFLFDQFDPETIDFIHIRFMSLSFTKEQYKQVVHNCWKLLKPGGYLELMEMDFMIYSSGPTTEQMNHDSKSFCMAFTSSS
ncbi:S-adenosyl-L-methionine-dependent methyltransferase [Lichtheimia hyalospora FSU 10163]|nr:S-adenosyl-L-methionine-dependent methyltransferase [Lichtheimia hyalospora FSU 10163]